MTPIEQEIEKYAKILDTLKDEDFAVAKMFHEAYERLAPTFGYKTREESAKPWSEVPVKNKQLMAATCAELIPLIREECAKIAEGHVIQGEVASEWTRDAIAAAIREGK